MQNGTAQNLVERYSKLYCGLIYDVLEDMGYPYQILSHKIIPLRDDMKLVGPAFTIKGTAVCEKDHELRYKRLATIKEMRYPCVEVRDAGTPFNVALYGELSATTARAHGAVGAIVDGGIRDSAHLLSMDYPVFARYRNPVEAFGRWAMLDYQVPVLLHGELTNTVQVNPGDYIFGDADGVMVVPHTLTVRVIEECERVMGIEDLARLDFAKGEDPVTVFERHKRL